MTPPLPVITQNGFRVFCHPNGRFSAAVMVGNVQVYARDYQVQAGPVVDEVAEPDDVDFARAMGWKR